jgi:cytochrome c oxidase subunit IV
VPDYLCTSIVVLWNVLTEHSSLSYLVDYLLNYLCNGFICGSVLIDLLIFTCPSTNFYFFWCHIPCEISS